MRDVPENELFSAYLDGELTAAEQADVEQLLAASPQARQLLDELRTLSTTLQSLPQHKLEAEFSERVLRAAERRILTGDDQLARPAPLERRSWRQRFLSPRALIWSGVAVAAAVTVAILGPEPVEPPDENPVAMAPPRIAETTIPPATIQAVDDNGTIALEREGTLLEHGREQADTFADRIADKDAEGGGTFSVENGAPGPGAPAPEEIQPDVSDKRDSGEIHSKGIAPGGSADRAAARKPISKTGDQIDKDAAEEYEVPDRSVTNGRQSLAAKADSSFREKDGSLGGGGTAQLSVQGRQAGQTEQPVPTNTGVLLVQCDVSAEAVRQGAFDKLLVANGIALVEDEDAGRRGAAVVDVIRVDATPGQIAATLSELFAQPGQFLSVSVAPAPGVQGQTGLGRFSRRGGQQPVQHAAEVVNGSGVRALQDGTAAKRPRLTEQYAGKGGARTQPGRAWRVALPETALKAAGQASQYYAHRKSQSVEQLQMQPKAAAPGRPAAETTPAQRVPAKPSAAGTGPGESRGSLEEGEVIQVDRPAEKVAKQLSEERAGYPADPAPPPRRALGLEQSQRREKTLAGAEPPPELQKQYEYSPQPAARYQALFVLRVVGSDLPVTGGEAASMIEAVAGERAAKTAVEADAAIEAAEPLAAPPAEAAH